MANKSTIAIEIKVNDNGSVTIKQFGANAERSLRGVESAAGGAAIGFSKLQGVITALAGSYALLKVAQYIKDATMLAARYETMGNTMRVAGNNAGYTAEQMEKAAQGMQKVGISMLASRDNAMKLVIAHVDLAKASDLARVAQDVARGANINSSEAFTRMIQGMRSGEVEIFKTLGLTINLEAAYRRFEKANNLSTGAISAAQKPQAIMNELLKEGAKYAGLYEATLLTAGGQMLSMQRHTENLKVSLGLLFTPALTELVKGLTGEITGLNKELSGQGKEDLMRWGDNIRVAMLTAAGALQTGAASMLTMYSVYLKIKTVVMRGNYIFADKDSPIRKEIDAMAADARAAEAASAELIEKAAKNFDASAAGFAKERESAQKVVDEAEKSYMAAHGGVAPDRVELTEKQKRAIETIAEVTRKNAYELESIGKSQYEQAIIRINQEAEKYRIAGVDKVKIAKYVASEKAIAEAKLNDTLGAQRASFATEEATRKKQESAEAIQRIYAEYETAAKAYDDLVEKIDPVIKKQREMADAERVITAARQEGIIASDEEAAAAIDRVKQYYHELEVQQSASGKMFSEAAKGIYNSFETMFENIFDGSKSLFQNLTDSIFSMFKRLLAQMATLAIARPIIVPVVSAVGSMLGAEDATAGVLKSMGISLPAAGAAGTTDMGTAAANSAVGAGFGAGLDAALGSMQYTAAIYADNIAASALGESAGAAVGEAILGMSSAAFAGWTAGIGTFIVDMLQGKSFEESAVQGITTGGGAYAGATLGSYVWPGVGTAIGAAIGAFIGYLLGGLFGGNGGHEFTVTENINKEINAQVFDATKGFELLNNQATTGGTNDWYLPIRNAYSASIEAVQQSFNGMVFDFTSKLPEEMKTQILTELANTDWGALQMKVSAGRWDAGAAADVLASIAKQYAEGLATALGTAYANALSDYILAEGPERLIGNASVWKVLSDRVQANINQMFNDVAATIKGGDIAGGTTRMNNIVGVIDEIAQAMAPIKEIIETNGLTEYEKSLRAINQQFDQYAATLVAAGIDLAKYTDLEKARNISLAEAALSVAEDNLRKAFDAEKQRITDAYNLELSGMNTALDATKQIVADLRSNVDKLRAAKERMKLVDAGADQVTFKRAQADVARVLDQARKGDLSGLKDVQKSVDVLAGITPEMYANSTDYKRDFMTTYAAISELEQLTAAQVPVADQAVVLQQAAIDALTLNYNADLAWRDAQMNALLGIDTSVLSVTAAINALIAAQAAVTATGGILPPKIPVTTPPPSTMVDQIYQSVLDRQADAGGKAYYQAQVAAGKDATRVMQELIDSPEFKAANASDLIGGVYEAILGRASDTAGKAFYYDQLAGGKTLYQIAAEMMGSNEYATNIKAVRGFALGGVHLGGWRKVGENGPEFEYTPPSRIYSNTESKSLVDLSGLITEVRALRDEFKASIAKVEKNTGKTSDTLTIVTRGGRAMQTEAFV